MRFFLKLIFLLLLLTVLAVPVMAYLMVEDQRLVPDAGSLTPDEVQRAKALVRSHDPRHLPDGRRVTTTLNDRDVALLLRYAATLTGHGAGLAEVGPGRADLWWTARLPDSPLGQFLNVQVTLLQSSGLPKVGRFRAGRLEVPGPLADWLLWTGLGGLSDYFEAPRPTRYLEAAIFGPGTVSVSYRWDSKVIDAVRESLVSDELRASLRSQQEQLSALTLAPSLQPPVPLTQVLISLFSHAEQRASTGRPPAQENRAALLVLASYLGGPSLAQIVPEANKWPRARQQEVVLAGRSDLAQHFAISAAIAAVSNTRLANTVGVLKEMSDSQGGSGFSFRDLAADRAGTRFGELAGGAEEAAWQIQRRLSQGVIEADVMPPVGDLPENMQRQEFERRFGGTEGSVYRDTVAGIDAAIADLELYQQ